MPQVDNLTFKFWSSKIGHFAGRCGASKYFKVAQVSEISKSQPSNLSSWIHHTVNSLNDNNLYVRQKMIYFLHNGQWSLCNA